MLGLLLALPMWRRPRQGCRLPATRHRQTALGVIALRRRSPRTTAISSFLLHRREAFCAPAVQASTHGHQRQGNSRMRNDQAQDRPVCAWPGRAYPLAHPKAAESKRRDAHTELELVLRDVGQGGDGAEAQGTGYADSRRELRQPAEQQQCRSLTTPRVWPVPAPMLRACRCGCRRSRSR